ncbi:hypothetical protein GCM10009848_00350 [Micromonospora lupini]
MLRGDAAIIARKGRSDQDQEHSHQEPEKNTAHTNASANRLPGNPADTARLAATLNHPGCRRTRPSGGPAPARTFNRTLTPPGLSAVSQTDVRHPHPL